MKTLIYPLFLLSACFFTLVTSRKDCISSKKSINSKLICYYSNVEEIDGCFCTHVILPPNADVKSIERVRQASKGVKVYVSVNEFNQGLIDLLKSSKVDGLEINLKKLDSKNDISDFISTVKSKIGSHLDIALSVPSKSDLVAKYFDFKALSKYTDLFILQTAFLGASTNVTFHPSRLSGMWDMQNTDSVVDLISGLGAPLSKLVVAAPVQAFQFTLQNEEYTAPGSPALELKSITRDELCKMMHGGKNWTLERDEDQAGPYIFRKNQWIAFEDTKSMDIKAKYSRIRGLAGIALKDLTQDGGAACGYTILEATYNGLSRQARAPRGAVLHSLEREILENPTKPLDSVQLSPYRISRIIDTEGKIHVTRQDTRTEFQCSRQGYFVHPRSCNRFYRCVKFDQRSGDFNVFEFDCPAGLAFDERVEVCVWPGSLPHGTPCSGSSEIAPVPRKRFECPSEPGYYADPENCRWFFACLDHGKSPLSAYEFRCPFGLGFDSERLVCEWPWLVPKCAGTGTGIGLDSEYYYGGGNGYTGYSGNGVHSTGLVLQSYDGLGSLGAVKLGGVSGKLERPIATVYSNVDGGALGLGYQNNGGYIVGGGLGYKAAQALENAGLLKVNNGAGYQAIGQNQQGTVYATSDLNSGNANIQYSSGYQAGSGLLGKQGAAVSVQSFTQYAGQNGAASGTYSTHANENQDSQINAFAAGHSQYQGGSGQYQDSYLHSVQGSAASSGYLNGGGASSVEYQAGRQQSGGSGQYQGVTVGDQDAQIQVAQANIGAGIASIGSGYIHSDQRDEAGSLHYSSQGNQEANGAVSSQSFTQYNGDDQRGSSYNYESESSGAFNGGTKLGVHVNGYNSGADQQNTGFIVANGQVNQGSSGAVSSQSFTQYDGKGQQGSAYVYQSENGGGYNTGYEGNRQGIQVTDYSAAAKQQNGFALNGQVDQGSSAYAQGGSYVLQSGAVSSGYEGVGQGIQVTGYANANDPQNGGYIASSGQVDQGSGSEYVNSGSYVTGKTDFSSDYAQSGGAVSTQSFTRYHGQQEIKSTENYDAGIRGNVQIVGGGYSAVGTLNGVRVSSNWDSEDVKTVSFSSTASPISVTTYAPVSTVSSIPTVTAVPVPGIKTSTGFETYKGGVIANIPELQYKIQSEGESGFLRNISSSFANFVVTTPATVTKTQQTYSQDGGYVYEKPGRTFEEGAIRVSTARPFVAVTSQEPQVYFSSTSRPLNTVSYSTAKPVQSTTTYQKYDSNGGFNYEQSSEFEQNLQGAVVNTYSTISTARPTTYISQQPQVYVSSTTANPAVSTYSFAQELNQKLGGYNYDKPEVKFEEGPKNPTIISKFTIRGPTAQKTVNTGSYYYENPAVKYEERPVVQLKQKTVVENYAYQQPAQPAVVSQYYYQQPSIQQQQPIVPLYKQPQLLATYTYQPPVQKAVYKQPVSTYTYQTVAQQSLGLNQDNQQQQFSLVQKPAQDFSYQNGGGTSYQYIKFENNLEEKQVEVERKGYLYPKPAIAFEEVPQNQVVRILSTPKPNLIIQDSKVQQGYVYEQPAVKFEETHVTYSTPKPTVAAQPAVVTSYFNTASTHSEANAEYDYSKQDIASVHQQNKGQQGFVYENPVVYSTAKPIVNVQPAVVTSYFNIGTSKTQEQENVERQRVAYSYPKPTIKFEETPVTYSTPRPALDVQPVTPAVVTSYFNIQSSTPKPNIYVQEDVTYSTPRPISVGYSHPRPQIKFEETPVSWSTPKPAVSSFSFSSSLAAKSEESIQANAGYTYEQPEIRFEEKPVRPAVVSSYNYISSTTPQPQNVFIGEQESINYTPQPQVIVEQKPAQVTSYFNLQPSRPTISKGYDYPKPAVQFVEEPQSVLTTYDNKQPVEEVPFIKKTAYVTGQYQQNAQENYNYQKSSLGRSSVVENYIYPNYEKVKQAVFGQKLQGKVQYEQPQVVLNYVQSTPRPTFVSTVKTIATKNLQPVTPAIVTFYDSRLTSTPQTYVSSTASPEINIYSTTSRPISKFSFSSLDDEYQYNQNVDIVKSTTYEPTRKYLPVTSRVRVTTALPKVTKTKVVEAYVAPEVTTLARDYLPVRTRTKSPAREYLPVEITTPSREYIPSRQRIRVTSTTAAPEITTLHREYLPVRITTTGAPSYVTRKPSAIRVVRPVAVIKQNDAHPLLSAKLGAQCTCVSNSLKLRKNQKIIIVEDDQSSDEDNDDDGYIVDDGKQGQVIENYSYEPQKVIDITPVPDVYVKSTSVTPQTYAKKRVRVRPVVKQSYLPVTEVSEVFYKKNTSPAFVQDDSAPSDGEIVKAVRTGLKLVKEAAKEGAREGTQEALSGKQFDRYGPGGVRSKSETLQGSIDCQRAGLFRHPTQCNKFYACRWDCTKNRFTLHVFNCPVHLTFDNSLGACNWPSQGPACVDNTLITSD